MSNASQEHDNEYEKELRDALIEVFKDVIALIEQHSLVTHEAVLPHWVSQDQRAAFLEGQVVMRKAAAASVREALMSTEVWRRKLENMQ